MCYPLEQVEGIECIVNEQIYENTIGPENILTSLSHFQCVQTENDHLSYERQNSKSNIDLQGDQDIFELMVPQNSVEGGNTTFEVCFPPDMEEGFASLGDHQSGNMDENQDYSIYSEGSENCILPFTSTEQSYEIQSDFWNTQECLNIDRDDYGDSVEVPIVCEDAKSSEHMDFKGVVEWDILKLPNNDSYNSKEQGFIQKEIMHASNLINRSMDNSTDLVLTKSSEPSDSQRKYEADGVFGKKQPDPYLIGSQKAPVSNRKQTISTHPHFNEIYYNPFGNFQNYWQFQTFNFSIIQQCKSISPEERHQRYINNRRRSRRPRPPRKLFPSSAEKS